MKAWKKAVRKAGLDWNPGPHARRHFFSSYLAEQMNVIQALTRQSQVRSIEESRRGIRCLTPVLPLRASWFKEENITPAREAGV